MLFATFAAMVVAVVVVMLTIVAMKSLNNGSGHYKAASHAR